MSIPTAAAIAGNPTEPSNSPLLAFDPLHPAADAPLEVRWAAWQARGRVIDAATRRHALIGAPVLALVAVALYLLIGR